MKKNKKDIIEELDSIAPQLSSLKAKEPDFSNQKVPEGYFDQLSNQIMNQLELEPNPLLPTAKQAAAKPWWEALFSNLLHAPYALGLASVAVLLLVVFVLVKPFEKDAMLVDKGNQLENLDLSSEELYAYILENIEEFDAETILDLAADVPMDFFLPEEMEANDAELEELMEELLEQVDFSDPSDIL